MSVDDPVHHLKTGEGDRKDDAAVFVNVRRGHAKHTIQVFHVTLWVGRWWGRRGWRQKRGGWGLFIVAAHWSAHAVFGWSLLLWVSTTDGVFAGASFAMHLGIMNLKMNSLQQRTNCWKERAKLWD